MLSRNQWIAVVAALAIVGSFFGFKFFSSRGGDFSEDGRLAPDQTEEVVNLAENKLLVKDFEIGEGPAAEIGDTLVVHYIGFLTDQTQFDNSRERNSPFTFKLGDGQVIAGWDQGLAGMKVGGMRRLIIPPHLAYGAEARGNIPANSTLVFFVELLEIK